MEGLMFYWISWSFWVYLTFILKKDNPYRLKIAAMILIVIILASVHFNISRFDVNFSGLFLLFYSYTSLYGKKIKTVLYFFISSFIISIAYVTFHLFEMFDPIWLIFKKEWMMGICIGYLTVLLQKTLKGRLLVTISGTMQGEILYSFILNKYDFPYQIGSFAYLDTWSLTISLIVGWCCIEYAGVYLENYFKVMEEKKQRSS
ncbi:MAG: hypothetical protein Q8934_04665 [Bacillota bacterium]|nr:hypothetical protein [Bacillota bacterium]